MDTFMTSFRRWSWPCSSVLLLLLVVLFFSPGASSLLVVPGSNCTAVCSNNVISSNTTVDDITCIDKDYNSTDVGRSFQSCISCQMESHTFDHQTKQTDLGWALCKS